MPDAPILFHVSDDPAIPRFDPRPAPNNPVAGGAPVVWAVDAARLCNYPLPRDCPRVTFYPRPDSSPDDVLRLMGPGPARAVVAVEWAWLDRIRGQTLYRYALPPETFACVDACAGYWVSLVAVTPARVDPVPDLLAALSAEGVELRFLPSLWPLGDAVLASTLQYSLIRMRNAQPRLQDGR